MGLMYAPHTVTIINATENEETLEMQYQATVIPGVFLDIKHSTLAAALGANSADSAELFIPMDAAPLDAVSGSERVYASPKDYLAADDKSALWTLQAADTNSSAPCYFVKGEAQPMSLKEAKRQYEDVFVVTAVLARDFGGVEMHHWQVEGK